MGQTPEFVDSDCPYEDACYEAVKEEAYNKHLKCKCSKDQVEGYVQSYIKEEMRKAAQGRRGVELDIRTANRLLPEPATYTPDRRRSRRRNSTIPTKKKKSGTQKCFNLKLQMDKKPAELTGVTIFPNNLGGETIVGTLEAHANGFVYVTPCSHLHIQFMYKDVKKAFFGAKKIKMAPLLHLQLHHPIKVGTENTKDIQFWLVPTPVGLWRSDNDSNEIENNQKKTRHRGLNKDLKNFVKKVRAKWRSIRYFSFDNLDEHMNEFSGVLLPSKASVVLGLTWFSSLVVVADTFTIAVSLHDIEIVNLAILRPGEIDMTVIFRDFKRDPLQITIPFEALDRIKGCLDDSWVKYYVNNENPDWKSIVKGIIESPKTFIQKGGWKFFDLEDPGTIRYYLLYILKDPEVEVYEQMEI